MRKPRALYLIVALIGVGLALFVYLGEREAVRAFTMEDGIVENVTAFLYFFGAGASLYALIKKKYLFVASVWLILCIVFMGEETSWFQRVIGYSVPYIEAQNSQSEFNFHNLGPIHSGGKGNTFLDEEGRLQFSFDKLLQAQTLFRIGFIVYFLILPILLWMGLRGKLEKWFDIPPFNWQFIAAIWSVIAISGILQITSDAPVRQDMTEMRELFFSAFIFLYTLGFASRESTATGPGIRSR